MSSRHVGNAFVSLTHFSSCDSSPSFVGRWFDLSAVFLCVMKSEKCVFCLPGVCEFQNFKLEPYYGSLLTKKC